MADHQKILILDFGGQYTQLIARRVRECHVYSEVVPWNIAAEEVRKLHPAGIILSGGPSSVHDENAPVCDPGIYTLGVPVLGICYGMQLTAHLLGGTVERAAEREYGRIEVRMRESAVRHKQAVREDGLQIRDRPGLVFSRCSVRTVKRPGHICPKSGRRPHRSRWCPSGR